MVVYYYITFQAYGTVPFFYPPWLLLLSGRPRRGVCPICQASAKLMHLKRVKIDPTKAEEKKERALCLLNALTASETVGYSAFCATFSLLPRVPLSPLFAVETIKTAID